VSGEGEVVGLEFLEFGVELGVLVEFVEVDGGLLVDQSG
jgi:hypothetical protein